MKASIYLAIFLVVVQISFQDYHYCGTVNPTDTKNEVAQTGNEGTAKNSSRKKAETDKAKGTVQESGGAADKNMKSETKSTKAADKPDEGAAKNSSKKKSEADKAKGGFSQTVQETKGAADNSKKSETKSTKAADKPDEDAAKNSSKKKPEADKAKGGSTQTGQENGGAADNKTKSDTKSTKSADKPSEKYEGNKVALKHLWCEINEKLSNHDTYQNYMHGVNSRPNGTELTRKLGSEVFKLLKSIDRKEVDCLNKLEKQFDEAAGVFCSATEGPNDNKTEKAGAIEALKEQTMGWGHKLIKRKSKTVSFNEKPDEVFIIENAEEGSFLDYLLCIVQ